MSTSGPPGDKPKLIIDEDWKSQVEREREEARRAAEQAAESGHVTEPSSSTTASDSLNEVEQPSASRTPAHSADDESEALPPPPPASFPFLVSMLGTNALAAMGQLGDDQESPHVRLDYAKHYIDLLGVLEEKTKGNLSADESALLLDWLHQLRLGFVEVAKRT